MIPMMLDPGFPVLLVGRGGRILQRLALVEAAGARDIRIRSDLAEPCLRARAGARLAAGLPGAAEIAAARLLFVADLSEAESRPLAAMARAARVPVNVEDVPALCDFHVPATVRRGDLVLTVSTSGVAPGAAARIRAALAEAYGPEWEARMQAIALLRRGLRAAGASQQAVARAVASLMEAEGWLPAAAAAAHLPPRVLAEAPGSTINAF